MSPKSTTAAVVMAALIAGCSGGGPAATVDQATPTFAASAPPPTLHATAQATATPDTTPAAGPTSRLPSPEAVDVLWEAHGPVTDKTSTASVAINPVGGNVWVGVPFENLFWIFSPDGQYLESWGESGTGAGQFDFSDHEMNPDGFAPIAFAPDGSFVVGDTGNYRVQLFNAERRFVREWGSFGFGDGKFGQIVSVATDGKTVYVGDGERLDIQAFDMDGNYLRTIGGDGGFFFVALDSQGRVHATNPGGQTGVPQGMAIFDPHGGEISVTDFELVSAEVVSLAVDNAGNTYVPIQLDHLPWTPKGLVHLDAAGRVVGVLDAQAEFAAVAPGADALYVAKGIQLDSSQWTFLRKYALPAS